MLGITQKCLIVFPQGSKIGESGKFGSLGGLEGGRGAGRLSVAKCSMCMVVIMMPGRIIILIIVNYYD